MKKTQGKISDLIDGKNLNYLVSKLLCRYKILSSALLWYIKGAIHFN